METLFKILLVLLAIASVQAAEASVDDSQLDVPYQVELGSSVIRSRDLARESACDADCVERMEREANAAKQRLLAGGK